MAALRTIEQAQPGEIARLLRILADEFDASHDPRSGVLRHAARLLATATTPAERHPRHPPCTCAEGRRTFTPHEAADEINVSGWAINDAMRTGELRSIKAGGRRLIRHDALVDYLDSRPDTVPGHGNIPAYHGAGLVDPTHRVRLHVTPPDPPPPVRFPRQPDTPRSPP